MIATQTMTEFPVFSDNGTNTPPGEAKYSAGFNPAETLPAVWLNYFLNRASSGVTTLNAGVESMEKELNTIVTGAGLTPDETKFDQLSDAIKIMIGNFSHPVGSLYWSSDSTDPANLFGGTWEPIKDKFVWAKGDSDTVNSTGGAKTVTLTAANMPRHTHGMDHTHCLGDNYIGGTTGSMNRNSSHTHSRYSNSGTNGWSNPVVTYDGTVWGGFLRQDGTDPYNNAPGIGTTDTNHEHTWGGSFWTHAHPFYFGGRADNKYDGAYYRMDTDPTYGNASGGADAHNNMPPYIVKYCWERTA